MLKVRWEARKARDGIAAVGRDDRIDGSISFFMRLYDIYDSRILGHVIIEKIHDLDNVSVPAYLTVVLILKVRTDVSENAIFQQQRQAAFPKTEGQDNILVQREETLNNVEDGLDIHNEGNRVVVSAKVKG